MKESKETPKINVFKFSLILRQNYYFYFILFIYYFNIRSYFQPGLNQETEVKLAVKVARQRVIVVFTSFQKEPVFIK